MTLTPSKTLTIALAGNPNSGKTTIFNCLTGLRQKVANYPGITVEKKTGKVWIPKLATGGTGELEYAKPTDGDWATVIDLPGTYSLISRSPDEVVAMEVLRGLRRDTPVPDVVVVVVDASNLQRNLYLVSQLIELGRPMVVALNMMDIAERRGLHLDPARLAQQLGIPVIPVVGHKKKGVDELKAAILNATVAPLPDFDLPAAMKEELHKLADSLPLLPGEGGGEGRPPETTPLELGASVTPTLSRKEREPDRIGRDRRKALAERLLIGDSSPDIAHLPSTEPVGPLLAGALLRLSSQNIDPIQADVEAHYKWIESVTASSLKPACETLLDGIPTAPAGDGVTLSYEPKPNLTERADRILIHKVWGLLIFAGLMGLLFVAIFSLASPLMDGMENAVKWLGGLVTSRLPAEGALHDLWTDGIVAGVGGVVVFVPQIAILFFFLAIMEDSGYLARAAFLMDRLLSKVGLHGKSFIPLLSSFACAIPGIMAARTIESRRDRLATIFIAPFMSCSARLPVYTLLIGSFFAGYSALVRGGIMLSLYVLGVVAAVATAFVFKRTLLKGAPQSFILELPSYKVPQATQVLRQVWTNTWAFLAKAGTVIFALSVILWALMYYPRLTPESVALARWHFDAQISVIGPSSSDNEESVESATTPSAPLNIGSPATRNRDSVGTKVLVNRVDTPTSATQWRMSRSEAIEQLQQKADEAVAAEQLRHSYAGRFGHFIEPAIKPLGYDWKMGIGLVGAFAAREVFVSTMGIVYSVGSDDEDTAPLEEQMQADTYANGKPVWTPLVAASLLIWFVLAMQCMSTLAIVRRETAGWRWPIFMLVYMNGLAYVVCLAVYQIGTRFGG